MATTVQLTCRQQPELGIRRELRCELSPLSPKIRGSLMGLRHIHAEQDTGMSSS